MNHARLSELAAQHGDAFYLFDPERFAGNVREFGEAFRRHYTRTGIAYSYKTNYTPAICRQVDALGGYAEVVSEMEYALARRVGVAPERIIYNGPCKSPSSLTLALTSGSTVNLDSARDLELVVRIAAENPSAPMRVAIRCNFEVEGMRDSRFGIDVDGPLFAEAVAAIRRIGNARLAGLHCHFPNRELESFTGRTEKIVAVADRVFDAPPEFINVGGGFFGRMPASLLRRYSRPVPSLDDYGAAVGGIIAKRYGNAGSGPELIVEPGTALVADTFRFVTRVIERKTVRSRNLAFVAGSIFNVSPYSRSMDLPVTVHRKEPAIDSGRSESSCDVVGYTCIEGDVLTRGLQAEVAVGDFLVYENVGSYSIVMKPPFILPNVPILAMSGDKGMPRVIRRAESMTHPFEHFDT